MVARLDMFDKMMLLFGTKPDFGHGGYGEDLAWKIDRFIEEENKKQETV